MATGWSQAQVDYLKKYDPNKLANGYKASGATKGQGTLQGGSGGTAASSGTKTLYGRTYNVPGASVDAGSQNPAGWTTEQRTAAVKASANPYDDRVAGKPYGPGDSRYGPGGTKAPTDWTAYGNDKVNKDLKWQFDQGKTGFNTYEAYLKDHWNRIGKYENRIAKPQEAPARRSSGGGYTAPAEPVRAPFNDYKIEDITAPASGLEDTIKTSPQLLRERRKRSYLTRG